MDWIPIIYKQPKEVIQQRKRNIYWGPYFSPLAGQQWSWDTDRTQTERRSSCSSTFSSPFYLDVWYYLWFHMYHGNFVSSHWTMQNPFWRRILMIIADCGSVALDYHAQQKGSEHGLSILLLKVVLGRSVKASLQETFPSELLFIVLSCIYVTSNLLLHSLPQLLLLPCPILPVLNLSVRDRSLWTATQY